MVITEFTFYQLHVNNSFVVKMSCDTSVRAKYPYSLLLAKKPLMTLMACISLDVESNGDKPLHYLFFISSLSMGWVQSDEIKVRGRVGTFTQAILI